MPTVSTPDKTTLDSFPQGSKLAIAVFQPKTIVTGTVQGTPGTGAQTVVLNGKVETEAPDKHMTVYAGSAAGLADGGKVRLKQLSGSTMTVAPNFIEWNSYSYITIKKVIDPVSILPDLGNDKEDGDTSYTDENTKYHPLGRIGPIGLVGYTDIPVKFHSNSTVVATGASISTHAWTFPSGSPGSSASAGSEASPVEVTWSAATGHEPHYVKYVVTDSNGKTHTRRMPVWIFDSIDDAYCDLTIDSMSWTATITVLQDADIANFPEDAMVVVFAKDYYAGHETSIGGNWKYAEHVIFGGWIASDTVFRDKDKGSVTFEVQGPAEKMKNLLCWPANLEDNSSPDSWHELSNMTADRAAFHVITEHTTMDQICDVNLTGNTKRFLYTDIPEDDPYTQIADYCLKPVGANILSSRQGMIYFDRNPNLRPVSERSGIATVIALDINDKIRSDPGLTLAVEDHEKPVAQVDFIAFKYDGVEPEAIYSLAPGDQYHTGGVEKVDGIRADSQSESNSLAGLYLANLNNIWREVSIPVWNWRIFDIAPQEYTTLTLVAADTRRGVEWSAQKLICRSVVIEYDHEANAVKVDPVFEKDSFGPAGITGDYPDEPPTDDGGGITPGDPVIPPTYNPQDLLIGDKVNGVWYLPVGGSVWEERNTGLTTTDVEQLGWDPWWFTEYKKNTTNPLEAIIWVCEDGGQIFRDLNLGSSWTLKTPVTDPPNDWGDSPAPTVSDLLFVQRTDNIHKNKHHYFMAVWQNAASAWRSWLLMTQDDGATWTWKSLAGLNVGSDGWYYPVGLYKASVGSTTGESNIFARDGVYGGFPYDPCCGGSSIYLDFGANIPATPVSVKFRAYINQGISEARLTPNDNFGSVGSCHWWTGADPTGNTVYENTKTFNEPVGGAGATWVRILHSGFAGFPVAGQYAGYLDYVAFENLQAPNDYKGLWMDVDSQDGSTLFLTVWKGDDTLELQVRSTTDFSLTSTVSLGACTEAQLGSDYIAYPFTPTFNKSRVYVFGRMNSPDGLGNPEHLIQSTDTGSSFSSVENGLGASVLTNFRAEGEADGARDFYGVVSATAGVPKFYRGAEALAFISNITGMPNGLVNVDAFVVAIIQGGTTPSSISVGSNTAQSVMVVQSTDNGATWSDITLNLPTTGQIKTTVVV
jgi:hypothetical protein